VSVVAAWVYGKGQRVREAPITDEGLTLAQGEFVWVGLLEPEEAELRTLQRKFSLHPLAVEDALSAHQLPKVEVYGTELFVVAHTAKLEGDSVAYGETHAFLGPNHIITVRHGSARSHTAVRSLLEASPTLLQHGPDYVLHAILDFVVDGYTPIVDHIEESVLAIEQRALDAFLTRDEIRALFQLRRDLLRFDRILGPMEEVAGRLDRLELPCVDPEVRPYFRDIRDHVRRVGARVGTLREDAVLGVRDQRPAGAAAARGDHAAPRGVGGDPRRPHGGGGHLRDELRLPARAALALRVLCGPGIHRRRVRGPVRRLQKIPMVVTA
jgi:magnesium transporter